jgi:hypothetical protein
MARCLFAYTPNRYGVSTIAASQEARHPSDRRDTDTGQPVNLPIGQPALQKLNYAPPVRHGLDLGWGTQIAKKRPAFIRGLQSSQGCVQITLGKCFLPGADVTMAFHGVPM